MKSPLSLLLPLILSTLSIKAADPIPYTPIKDDYQKIFKVQCDNTACNKVFISKPKSVYCGSATSTATNCIETRTATFVCPKCKCLMNYSWQVARGATKAQHIELVPPTETAVPISPPTAPAVTVPTQPVKKPTFKLPNIKPPPAPHSENVVPPIPPHPAKLLAPKSEAFLLPNSSLSVLHDVG